ncbi:MAG: MFS transporter [Candidatus Abyssobacteria bacterium SURF_17]|uniref:MFS transporter n=1 Tax=Candidatus Abyssobacteria bacterium SURF_17 TaxID=2093361 RepID=A0A419ESX6_9BACT|nr:MAG: MFS transporter [Candidatus Abyssubacteria bacterium SURF_17]
MNSSSRIFYGWFVVLACFLVLFSLHGVIINTFGVFFKPVSESMGWSRATFSLALAIGAIAMAFGAPFVGKMLDSFGAAKTMLVGALLCGIGMGLLGSATNLLQFYVLFAVVGLGLSASTSIPVSLLIANWFERRRGIAMGMAFTGTSLGGMIMNPVNTYLVQRFGWRHSYVILAVAITVATVPLILLIVKTRPSEMHLLPDGEKPTTSGLKRLTGQNLQDAIRTSTFWFIAANMFLINFMANAVGVHGIPYLTDIGHSEMTAGITVGASMGFMTLGKLGFGFGADRWGARPSFVLSCLLTAVGIGILMAGSNLWMLALFVFIYGFPQGGPLALTPLIAAECHGLLNFGSIYGVMTLFSILGAAIGPVVVGKIYDVTHTYQGAFLLLIAITLVSAYCIHRARFRHDFAHPEPVSVTLV